MNGDISILIGILFGVGVYLLFHRNLLRVLFGTILLSNAVNIFLLSTSQNPVGKTVPIIEDSAELMVDPLPQALILTAIVISFGLTAYLIGFVYRLSKHHKSLDIDEIFSDSGEPNQ